MLRLLSDEDFNGKDFRSHWSIPTDHLATAQQLAQSVVPDLAEPPLAPPTKRFERKRGFSQPLADWFGPRNGLLAEHERWASPLLEQPELSAERVQAALGRIGATGLTRRRSVLYVLAQWLETNRRAAAVA